MNGEKHTFICYARHDQEFVRKLANDLRAAGIDIWMDVLDIPAGARWDRPEWQAEIRIPLGKRR